MDICAAILDYYNGAMSLSHGGTGSNVPPWQPTLLLLHSACRDGRLWRPRTHWAATLHDRRRRRSNETALSQSSSR